MLARTTALILVATLAVSVVPAAAQFPARSVNPEAVDFESAALSDPATGYRVDLFIAGSDIERDFPVKSFDVPATALGEGGRLRVSLKEQTQDVPNGQYVATVRVIAGETARLGAISQVFTLYQPGTPQDRLELARQERIWTRVAMAIGAGILLAPIVVR